MFPHWANSPQTVPSRFVRCEKSEKRSFFLHQQARRDAYARSAHAWHPYSPLSHHNITPNTRNRPNRRTLIAPIRAPSRCHLSTSDAYPAHSDRVAHCTRPVYRAIVQRTPCTWLLTARCDVTGADVIRGPTRRGGRGRAQNAVTARHDRLQWQSRRLWISPSRGASDAPQMILLQPP